MEPRKDPSRAPSRDPLALWVGTWMPDDVIDREARRLSEQERPADDEDSAHTSHE